MANRCLIHKNKLEDFKAWLINDGWVIEPTKGYYEVLRARKDREPLLLYSGKSTEHYSVMDKHASVIRKFIRSTK